MADTLLDRDTIKWMREQRDKQPQFVVYLLTKLDKFVSKLAKAALDYTTQNFMKCI
jgi:hypothetical protein